MSGPEWRRVRTDRAAGESVRLRAELAWNAKVLVNEGALPKSTGPPPGSFPRGNRRGPGAEVRGPGLAAGHRVAGEVQADHAPVGVIVVDERGTD